MAAKYKHAKKYGKYKKKLCRYKIWECVRKKDCTEARDMYDGYYRRGFPVRAMKVGHPIGE